MCSKVRFFFDPKSGEVITYLDLFTALCVDDLVYSPFVCPITAGQAASAVVRAVVLRQPLTLFDADFSKTEIAALGGTPEALERRVVVPGLRDVDLESALARSRVERGFRLTLFTSGSTGVPKKVSHGLEGLTRTLRVGPKHVGSRWGLAYNPTHIAGVQVILQALFNRNPLINLFQADRSTVLNAIRELGVTHISATPSFYRLLLPAVPPLDEVRGVTVGGERSEALLLKRLAESFPQARVLNLYASTEAGTLLAADGEAFGIAVELADRIRIVENQLEVHQSLLGEFDEGGPVGEWYRTGDVVDVVSDEPLRFRILSRERDWVNVGGHKVNPGEVEDALLSYPGIREAAVYGRPNSVLGQILWAEVVSTDEFSEASVRAYLAACLQGVKVPRMIKRVDFLTRTRTGKLSRVSPKALNRSDS